MKMSLIRQIIVYLLSGAAGYLMACLCEPSGYLLVGCQPAIAGLIGTSMGFFIKNFCAVHQLECMRFCILFLQALAFVGMLMFTMQDWKPMLNHF